MDSPPLKRSVHGTCIALGPVCAILRGPPGAGKSDLALRFLFLPAERFAAPPVLVADDQVLLRRAGERIIASCPAALSGRIEVRGIGIVDQPASPEAELKLLVDLDGAGDMPRFPVAKVWETILDRPILRVALDPFEASAPIKLALALQNFLGVPVD